MSSLQAEHLDVTISRVLPLKEEIDVDRGSRTYVEGLIAPFHGMKWFVEQQWPGGFDRVEDHTNAYGSCVTLVDDLHPKRLLAALVTDAARILCVETQGKFRADAPFGRVVERDVSDNVD